MIPIDKMPKEHFMFLGNSIEFRDWYYRKFGPDIHDTSEIRLPDVTGVTR
jgi:hypothetical protein